VELFDFAPCLQDRGCSCILMAVGRTLVGVLAVMDPIKPEARGVVAALHQASTNNDSCRDGCFRDSGRFVCLGQGVGVCVGGETAGARRGSCSWGRQVCCRCSRHGAVAEVGAVARS
jgi:hypothetical protein